MNELWKIFAEITVQPDDFPSGDTVGFMNIVTWADSAQTACKKIEAYFASFGSHIVEIEEATVLDIDFVYEDQSFHEMVQRAGVNPDAVLCGTFHSYKVN